MKSVLLSLPLAMMAGACADDLDHHHDDVDAGGGDSAHLSHTDNGDGSTTTRVDATRMAEWTSLDLESRGEAADADASWDLAFQRTKIKIDGGVSGDGGMQVAVMPGADFGAMAAAPATGWITDDADGDDEDAEPDLAFLRGDGWYSYDPSTHVVSPRAQVYVVRSVEGNHYKVQLTDYYDSAGTSGFVSFRWAPIDPPPGVAE